MPYQRRVVITGIGAVTPVGLSAQETWDALTKGKSGIAPITAFDVSLFKTKFAGEVKGFDPSHLMDHKEARKMDRYSQLSIAAVDEAMRDSQLDVNQEDKSRIGVIWGSGMGGLQTTERECFDYAKGDGTPHFNPFMIPKAIPNIAAGLITIRWGLKGLSLAVSSACSSSSHALIMALDQIRLGRADVIISGGADADVTYTGIGGFNALHALSTRNDSPATASRPFSKSRDGFILSEGAGCLILEDYEHAKARGAKIYAELVGGALTSDAYHMTAPDPEGQGAESVMRMAIQDAQISPDAIDYINTHGTSTPLGDIAEVKAIKAVFGEHVYHMNLSSTKSMTGHMLGAAGGIELIATALALKNGIVPPTINYKEADPECDLNYVPNQAIKADLTIAASNSLGFGGHNSCVALKKI